METGRGKKEGGGVEREGRWFINNQRCITVTASLCLLPLLLGFEMPPHTNTHSYTLRNGETSTVSEGDLKQQEKKKEEKKRRPAASVSAASVY